MTTDAQKCPILLLMSSNRQNRVLTKKFFRVQLAQKSPLPHVADVAGVAATSATPWRSWLPRPPRCGRGTATLTRRKRGKRGCHATATPLPHLDVTATRGSHAPSHAPPPPQQRNNVPPLQLHEDEEFQTRLAMEVCEEDEQESAHDLQQPLSDAPLQLHGDIPVRDVLQQKPGKPVDVPRTDGCFFSALLAASSTTFSFSSVEFFRETVFDPPRVSTTMRGFAQAACASDNADGKYTTVKEWQDWHRKSLTSADSHAISWTAEFLRVQINIVELTKEGTRSVKQITPTTVQHTVWLQQFGGTHFQPTQAFTEDP